MWGYADARCGIRKEKEPFAEAEALQVYSREFSRVAKLMGTNIYTQRQALRFCFAPRLKISLAWLVYRESCVYTQMAKA